MPEPVRSETSLISLAEDALLSDAASAPAKFGVIGSKLHDVVKKESDARIRRTHPSEVILAGAAAARLDFGEGEWFMVLQGLATRGFERCFFVSSVEVLMRGSITTHTTASLASSQNQSERKGDQ